MSEHRVTLAVIKGRVQGVGFRAWVQHQAERCGVQGWVRNRRDGSVEAVFAGSSEAVEAMLKVCYQGPPGSHVEGPDARDVSEALLAERPGGSGFAIIATV
jgi:acylphosphatase